MSLGFRVAPHWAVALASVLLLLASGCEATSALTDLTIAPPAGWLPIDPAKAIVPGTPLAAWSGPQGSSLVLYKTLPIPQGTAATVATDFTNRLTNLPGLEVKAQRTETWGGHEAARVEVVAPGTGDALAPSGTGTAIAPKGKTLVPTHRVALAFLRPTDTLWLTWHYPDSASAEIAPQIEATLRSLRLSQAAAASQSY
ncbi:MAG TPA: hypothetical protein VGZ22_11435 [Isosphaeraceae bacterium]|jgi:hypothetical protein|nr:hypothetical protein [Isosphaeraceae bacterium]